jgi:hypothetical protein
MADDPESNVDDPVDEEQQKQLQLEQNRAFAEQITAIGDASGAIVGTTLTNE